MDTNQTVSKGKTAAIIAHFSIIGCIIAIFMNLDAKNPFASFYIKQTFGIYIVFFVLAYFIGFFDNWMISSSFFIFIFIMWSYSFISMLQGEKKLIPFMGAKFQVWFNKLSE